MFGPLSKIATVAATLLATAATSNAQVTGTDLGTSAPPSSLDGYAMSAGSDGRATSPMSAAPTSAAAVPWTSASR